MDFAALLEYIDELLEKTGTEKHLVQSALKQQRKKEKSKKGWKARFRDTIVFQLRCTLLRKFLGIDYRAFSVMASDSTLIQWFLRKGRIDGFVGGVLGNGLSKSALERYDKVVPAEEIEKAVRMMCATVSADDWAGKMPDLDRPLDVRNLFADCTCLESNIHFPVDWVILRDAVRTMVRAIDCMRKHGLRHRIREPERFLRAINQLCMAMSAMGRKKDGGKKRRKTLRAMCAVVECVRRHAARYRDLLIRDWESRTDFTEAEANQVISRIDRVLERLPAALEQARERILKGHRVADQEKVLSLYEPDVHVIFRGKSGAQVEFGNTLYIAESHDGLIVDFEYFRDRAPAESEILVGSLDRCARYYGRVESVTTDRGFSSEGSRRECLKREIINNILPRAPRLMAEAFMDDSFRAAQKRRAQTEGRIGILKNVFIGDSLSGKGYNHQRIEIAWSILAHNLWILARLALKISQEKTDPANIPKSA